MILEKILRMQAAFLGGREVCRGTSFFTQGETRHYRTLDRYEIPRQLPLVMDHWIARSASRTSRPACRNGGSSRPRRLGISSCSRYQPLQSLIQRNLFASVAQRLRHPDQFPQEFIRAPNIGIIQQSTIGTEDFLDAGEIHVPKNRD